MRLITPALLFWAIGGLLLTACAHAPPEFSSNHLASFPPTSWRIQGKVLIKGVRKAQILRFDWQSFTDGQQNLRLFHSVAGDVAVLQRKADGQLIHINARGQAETLNQSDLATQLGLPLPLVALPYWLFARPAPGPVSLTHNNKGQLDKLKQKGWELHFTHYHPYHGVSLPDHIESLRADHPNQRLKLIIQTRLWPWP